MGASKGLAVRLCSAVPLLLGVVALWAQTGPGSPDVLTLEEALKLADAGNRELKIAELESRNADSRFRAARTYRLPQTNSYVLGVQLLTPLKFHFDQGVFGTFPDVGPVPAFPVDISSGRRPAALIIGQVNQPLTQQFRIGLGLSQLRLGQQITREQIREKQHRVHYDVRQAYFGILQAQNAMESAQETVKVLEELERATDQYVAQQAALEGDRLEVKARLAKARFDAAALRVPLATAMERVNSLIGRDVSTPFRVSPVLPVVPEALDIESARRHALEHRPEIRQAELRLRQADLDRRIKKSEYIPDISANFTYFSPLASGSILPSNVAAAGLLLTWSPFDFGRKKNELAEKSHIKEQGDLALRHARDLVTLDVGARFRAAEQSRLLLDVVRMAQAAAREQLRVAKHRYAEQAILLKDVLQAQAALSETNNQYHQAVLAAWTAQAELEKALGRDQ